jgi:hypothetical protein
MKKESFLSFLFMLSAILGAVTIFLGYKYLSIFFWISAIFFTAYRSNFLTKKNNKS